MPRTYKPQPNKKRYKKYDPDLLQKAVLELETIPNTTLSAISKKFNIHKSVLYRHSRRTMKTQGGQTALGPETEEYIIENINKCADWGYPMDTMDLRYIVKMYLDKLGVVHKKFKNNMPGPDFVQGFLKRHSNKISKRICENIKRVRAEVLPATIKAYQEELQKSLNGLLPSHIINYDETNLTDDPGRKQVLTRRGTKYPERVLNHSKVSTSIMMAATADGDLLPPYVVYKSSHLYDTWIQNGPEGTRYNRTSSGWFEGSIFEDWVENMIIPYFSNKPGRKCLIGDNLASHLSVDLIKKCKEHNIDFIFLPPNSTHLTQPLDVAFFRPMKQAWRHILLKWKKTDGRQLPTVPKGCFPKLLKILINTLKINAKNNIMAGFKKTGIYPLNVDEILCRLPQEEPNSEANESLVSHSVLELLKEMRYGSMNITDRKRKRKLNVISGKSVSPDETDDYVDSDQNNSKKTNKESEPQPSTSQSKDNIKETGKRKKKFKVQRIAHAEIEQSIEIEPYAEKEVTIEIQDRKKDKGKGKGKKTINNQEIKKDEKLPLDKTENILTDIKPQKQDLKSMPVIFFDDLIEGEEVIIRDDKHMIDAVSFDEQEFNFNLHNKESNIIEDNYVLEKKTDLEDFIGEAVIIRDDKYVINKQEINAKERYIFKNNNESAEKTEMCNINNENITQSSTQKATAKTCGLTILKQENIENIHTRKKVVIKDLKPLSMNSYINLQPQRDKTKPKKQIMKPKLPQNKKDFNYYKDSEEIYKVLMESD